MQKLSSIILVGFCSTLVLAGCAGSGSAVIARIGNQPLTLAEFEESYAKNNGGWEKATASTIEDRERFLNLLVNFKLKVKEAYDQGLMADSSIQNELNEYETTVATSYMLEKEIIEPMMKELYDRRHEELRASHILIRLKPDASPADTLAAYEKAMKVIDLVPKYSFDTLAVTYSEDQSASFNRGDLGYFTSGRMVPQFEDACYALKAGEYTHFPVRTQFGYHIIKVTSRQPNKGSVRVSHILRRFHDNQQDSTAVKDSVWIIYDLLKGGMDFAQAARRYSQDPGSATNGGDIGYFDRGGRLPPEIESLFFGTPLDSITEPVRMPYGYHIFKITGFRGIPPFSELEKDLRQQYQQVRYSYDYANYVANLKKLYHRAFDTLAIDELGHAFDTTQTPASLTWSDTLSNAIRQKTLFTVAGHPFTVKDFVDRINASADYKSMLLNAKNVRQMVDRLSEAQLVEEHARQVPQRYPAFSKLLKEYQDGILLYRVEQDEVWKKIVVNDSLLQVYFDANKEKYRWPDRVDFAEVYVTSDSLANAAYKEIQAGEDFSDVAAKYTMRSGYKEKNGVWGLTPDSLNELSLRAATMPVDSIAPPFAYQGGWSIIKVLSKDGTRVKTFEEAKPELMSSYQEDASKVRQNEWIADLKARYPVVIEKKLLSEAFKGKPIATE